jgi:phospholipid/cholesterol/gamma-HCH transport system substrate-binding protein
VASKRQKIEVGVFLISATTIFLAILFVLSGLRHKRLDSYSLEFEETVAGLTEGSKVTYRGVPVGKVLDLVVSQENRVRVTVGIDPAKVTLREGVRARYSMESVFGPYVIDLSGGERDAPPLEPKTAIPVKPSVLAGLEETLAETVPLTLKHVGTLMERLDGVLSKLKPEDIPGVLARAEETLANTAKAVQDFRTKAAEVATSLDGAIRATHEEMKRTSDKINGSLDKVQQVTDSAGKLLGTLQAAVEETRKPLSQSLERLDQALAKAGQQLDGLELPATVKAVREAADKVGQGADGIAAAAASMAKAREDLRRSLGHVETDLVRSLEELDRTLRAARELLETLERDPSALIRGKGQEE